MSLFKWKPTYFYIFGIIQQIIVFIYSCDNLPTLFPEGIYCIDSSHLKSFTVESKDNQNTRTHDPPSIQPGSSHPSGELAADTALSEYSEQGEEFLDKIALSEGKFVIIEG